MFLCSERTLLKIGNVTAGSNDNTSVFALVLCLLEFVL